MIRQTGRFHLASITKDRRRRMKGGLTLVLLVALLAGINNPLAGGSRPGDIPAEIILSLIETHRLTAAHVGVVVKSMRTGDIILEYNIDRYFIPASNIKLLTTFAALDVLGPDFRFRTEVYVREGAIPNQGVLASDILIKGYGDPTMGSRAIAQALAQTMDVTTISGDLYLDLSYFDDIYFGPGWTWDWRHYYIAALAFRMTRSAPEALRLQEFSPYSSKIYLNTVGEQIRRGFAAQGITIHGDLRSGRLGPGWRLAATLYSLPLSRLLRVMNSVSDNFIADQLFKKLGAARHGEGSFLMGSAVVRKTVAQSVGVTGLHIADGSGLSRLNLITPSQLLAVLVYAFQHPSLQGENVYSFEELKAIFLAGDNLFTQMLPVHSREPLVYAKTGTLANVVTLSGYLLTEDRDVLAFVIFINHTTRGGMAERFRDALLSILEKQ